MARERHFHFPPGMTAGLLALLLLFIPAVSQAQSSANSGQISGQVLDPTGAATPGVEVTVRQVETNYTRTAATDAEGRYAVGPVPIGAYDVTVKPAGMQESTEHVYVSLGG